MVDKVMNTPSATIVQALGWTLIHSMWEIALIGGLLFAANIFVRNGKAKVKYGLALVAMTACLLVPASTYLALSANPTTHPAVTAVAESPKGNPAVVETALQKFAPAASEIAEDPSRVERKIDPYLPKLVALWLLGLLVMTCRLAGGVVAVERFKRRASTVVDPQWIDRTAALAERLGVRRKISLRLVPDLDSPSVVGVLKAVILIPASVVTKLSPSQIEALLAHEIAHVKRHDYLVNLVQSVVETVLFYHPAVWWISSRVRAEREHCCDDLAIEATGDRATYAHALVSLEHLRANPRLAIAATSGSLVQRIRRIVAVPQTGPARGSAWMAAMLVVLVTSGVAKSLAARPADASTVQGIVLTPSGLPAAGVTLFVDKIDLRDPVSSRQKFELKSNSQGRFHFGLAPREIYGLCAYQKGVGLACARESKGGDLKIQLARGETKHLRIIDTKGRPVPGIRVEPAMISGKSFAYETAPELEAELSADTDSNGRVNLADLPVEGYIDYETQDENFKLDSKESWPRNNDPKAPQTYRLIPAGELTGTVSFQGIPVRSALVSARVDWQHGSMGGMTDDNGTFHLKRVPAGSETISVEAIPNRRKEMRTGADETPWICKPTNVTIKTGIANTINFHATPGAELSGTVVDPKGRHLQSGYVSILRSIDPQDTVNSLQILPDGTFSLWLKPGKYFIAVSDHPYGHYTPVTVAKGEKKAVKIVTERALVTLEVSVVDEKGHPVDGAQGQVFDPTQKSGPGGQFFLVQGGRAEHLEVPENALPYIYGNASKGNLFSDTHVLQKNGRMVLVLRPSPLTSFEGKITDSSGAPLPNAIVTLGFSGRTPFVGDLQQMGPWHKSTESDGRFEFVGIHPKATPILMIKAKGFADYQTPVLKMKLGSTLRLAPIRLKKSSWVVGRVVDQYGAPVAGAEVSVRAMKVSDFFSKTDANGRFKVSDILPGNYWLDISKGYSEAHLHAQTGTDQTYKIKIAPGNAKSSSY
jgi:beta-lactamase regulating signal transducer with metallopeptidase domain/protocatechuate 3,4-dioxygenase beta subunit